MFDQWRSYGGYAVLPDTRSTAADRQTTECNILANRLDTDVQHVPISRDRRSTATTTAIFCAASHACGTQIYAALFHRLIW